jgi:peptidoglycan/xylan/chitin deacetylase (PgdA/CDA1 family)
VTPTIAIDALTAEHYPALVEHCRREGAEFLAHGISVSRMITSRMTETEERAYIESATSTIAAATGARPTGWFGPEYGESERTPTLLAEAGYAYVCDWVNDEQPYPMTTPSGDLTALPITFELDDVNAMFDRRVPFARWGRMLTEGFEVLYADGADNGRLLVLNLHPWLVGQPFRIRALDQALALITARDGVWTATGGEVAAWYRDHGRAG